MVRVNRKSGNQKRKRNARKLAMRVHAKRRLKSRYGLEVNHDLYGKMVDMIKAGESQFVCRVSNTRSLHVLRLDDQDIRVVYDRSRGAIVTALPITDVR